MKNIRLLQPWSKYYAGTTVGVEDAIADNLIGQGIAIDPNAPAVAPEPEPAPAKPKAKAKKKAKR